MIRTAIVGALTAKAVQVARREAAKPENQQRAKQMLEQLRARTARTQR